MSERLRPDVVVHLPEGKDVIIDAKVSLVAYDGYCAAETEVEKKSLLAEHVQSVKPYQDAVRKELRRHQTGEYLGICLDVCH